MSSRGWFAFVGVGALLTATLMMSASAQAEPGGSGGGRRSGGGLGNTGIQMPGGPLPTDSRPLGFGTQVDGFTYTQQFGFPTTSGQVTDIRDPGAPGTKPRLSIKTEERSGSTPEEQGFFLTDTLRYDGWGELFLYTSPQDPTIPDSYILLVYVPPQAPTPPSDPTIRNWRTTRVDIVYQARREAATIIGSIGLPGLALHANPPQGLVNVPSWFWATVASGQLDPAGSRTITSPWETTWEEAVSRCVSGIQPGSDPPVVNPCASRRTDWESRQISGVDTATVAAQLVVTRASWWFGDGRYQPYGREGIGEASFDINNPPPVRHLYTTSSLQQIAGGGYNVELDASWEARVTLTTSTGQSDSFAIPGARTNVYAMRHEVRESQAIVGRSP